MSSPIDWPLVKIKLYQLAAELRISEGTLMEWLHRRGYKDVRRGDWLSGQLARASRVAFKGRSIRHVKQEVSASARGGYRESARGRGQENQSARADEFTGGISLPPSLSQQRFPSVPQSTTASTQSSQRAESVPLPRDYGRPASTAVSDSPSLNYAHMSPQDLWELIDRERARARLLQQRLEDQRIRSEAQLRELRVQHERSTHERSVYRQRAQELTQNQATLDQTCADLSLELEQTREELTQLQERLDAQAQVHSSLDQVNQQKRAWRARALELEERVQSGQKLSHQLKELGLDTFEKQTKLFQTLLSSPESAAQLFNAIKMVDREAIDKLISRWVVPTCTHPLCHQTNVLRHQLSLRVDRASRCEVCQGDADRRWFQRMTALCERANIKRFLMVGAESIHGKTRALMEGQSVEFRLISSDEQSSQARIQSRLESCDLLILWGGSVTPKGASSAYREMTSKAECPYIEINGDRADMITLARQILYWVSRNGGD